MSGIVIAITWKIDYIPLSELVESSVGYPLQIFALPLSIYSSSMRTLKKLKMLTTILRKLSRGNSHPFHHHWLLSHPLPTPIASSLPPKGMDWDVLYQDMLAGKRLGTREATEPIKRNEALCRYFERGLLRPYFQLPSIEDPDINHIFSLWRRLGERVEELEYMLANNSLKEIRKRRSPHHLGRRVSLCGNGRRECLGKIAWVYDGS